MFDKEELELLMIKGQEEYITSELLACKLAEFALGQAQNKLAVALFSVESQKQVELLENQKARKIRSIDAKNDDLTVAVAYILTSDWVNFNPEHVVRYIYLCATG